MSGVDVRIHTTAIVEPGAELGAGVTVGAHAFVGAGVRLGCECIVHPFALLTGEVVAGARNTFYPHSVTGTPPQDRRHKEGDRATLELGDANEVREHVTLHVGSQGGTRIGSRNLFMVGAHVAHDAVVSDDVILSNGVQLAGHVTVGARVVAGGLAAVAQHVRIGEGAFLAGGAMVEHDIPPFVIVQGDRARVRALNVVGLTRSGVPAGSLAALRRAFRILYGRTLTQAEALRKLAAEGPMDPYVEVFIAGVGKLQQPDCSA